MYSFRGAQHPSTPQNVPLPDGHCQINQLPHEILSIIFKYSFEQKERCYNHETLFLVSEILAFELQISHVCRLWRNIALDTPSLWTNISVITTESLPYERVVAHLERSKSLPLDIYIAGGVTQLPSVEADTFEALLALLVPHLSRWASIQVVFKRYEYMHTFLKAVSGPSVPPATRLKELRLLCKSRLGSAAIIEGGFSGDDFILFGGSAPLLRTLVLYAVYVDWSQAWIQSAPNLQTLHLAYHEKDLRPTSAILLGAHKLRTLKIWQSGPWDDTVGPLLHLPNLLELEIRDEVPQETTRLLRRLCSPALKTLTLDFIVDTPEIYSDLVALLVGPATQVMPSSIEQPYNLLRSLETLNLESLPCTPDCAEMLYRELVNLKGLTISRVYTPESFWDLLFPESCDLSGLDLTPKQARAESTIIFLPSLKDLVLSGVPINELPTLVMERRNAGVPLRSISTTRSWEGSWFDEAYAPSLRDKLEKFEII